MNLNQAFEVYHIAAVIAAMIVALGILAIIYLVGLRLSLPIYIRFARNHHRKDTATELLKLLKAELI